MKKLIPLLFTSSLLISSCSLLNDKGILSNEVCLEHKTKIEEQIKYGFSNKTGDSIDGSTINSQLEEIFYSPVLKGCLFIFKNKVSVTINGKEELPYFSRGIAYESGSILFGNYSHGGEFGIYGEPKLTDSLFEEKIKELKGE